MLIVALVLAVISLAALVTAVVTSNEAVAWVCIGLSALGVVLLIVDAIRDRHRAAASIEPAAGATDRTEVLAPVAAAEVIESDEGFEAGFDEDEAPEDVPAEGELAAGVELPGEEYPEEQDSAADLQAVEDYPDELLHDEPDYDIPSDDEPSYPVPAEEAAIHIVGDTDIPVEDADHSATIVYSAEPPADESSADESSTVTESYVVITDEPEAAGEADESATVIYADESSTGIYADEISTGAADETDGPEERRGSD